MRRLFAAAVAFALLSARPLAPRARDDTEEPQFQPAEAISVEVTRPIPSTGIMLPGPVGTVVLDVMISKTGEVESVQVRRDIAPITEKAVQSVRTWTFAPAKLNGQAVASRVTVAVTHNPEPPFAGSIPLPPLIHQDDEARIQSVFQPPEVTHATFPTFPILAVIPGEVILEASINETGKAHRTKVLCDAPPFTTTAIQAVEDWRFIPATLNGRPLKANVILVFVFPPILQHEVP